MAKKDEKPLPRLRRYELRVLEYVYEQKVFTPILRIHTLACALQRFTLDDWPDNVEAQEFVRAVGRMIDDLHDQMYDIVGRPTGDAAEYPGRFIGPKGVNHG